MKKLSLLTGLIMVLKVAMAQQLETFDSGSFTNIFYTNQPANFVLASGVGLNGTTAITPLNIQFNLNYLRRGSFDFSTGNATMQISAFFRVKTPTVTGLGNDTLEMGFVQSLTATSFIAPGTNGDISYWIYPASTALTNGGYQFETTVDASVYNGSSSAGYGFGSSGTPILKPSNWYKATFLITRDSATTLDFLATIDDYGTDGQTYQSRIDTIYFTGQSGISPNQFSYLTSDKSYYPALGGISSAGLSVMDNVGCSGTLTPNIAESIQTDVELDFATVIGKNYYINSSPDLIQWTTIEVVSGTGTTVTRYYQTTSSAKFFRVVQD